MTRAFVIPGQDSIVLPDTRQIILKLKTQAWVDGIYQTIPGAYFEQQPDHVACVVPMHDDTIRLLFNMGWPTTGLEPFWYYFPLPKINGKFDPMWHQLATAAFMSVNKRAYCLNDPRTGKTGGIAMAMEWLQWYCGIPGAFLTIATVSNMVGVWHKTLTKTFPHRKVVVLHGGVGAKDRLRKLEEPADHYIINYDGVKMIQTALYDMVAAKRITLINVDELTHYGNTDSGRWEAADEIINGPVPVEWAWGLTGSPGGNPPAVYGFTKAITPWMMPVTRQSTWEDMCYKQWGSYRWQRTVRVETDHLIRRVMQPAIRFAKKEVMPFMPPAPITPRDCELTSEQRRAYDKMKKEMILLTESGQVIEAVHKSALIHKLFQIALGSVKDQQGNTLHLKNEKRVKTIIELIKEGSYKTVIYGAYTASIHRLTEQLRAKKYTVEYVDGSVSAKKRDKIFNDFQEKKNPHVIVAHPQTVAFGVELAAADTFIYNGPTLSGTFNYQQSLERGLSAEQRADIVNIIQLSAIDEERAFFEALDNNVTYSQAVNDLFSRITKGELSR